MFGDRELRAIVRFIWRPRGSFPILTLTCLLFACLGLASAQQAELTEQQRHERFQADLHNVVLEGYFTITSDSPDSPQLKKEQYEIRSVKPTDTKGIWLFDTRITYGDHDLALPLPLPVRWAGNTPVITLDSFTIPGLGTFSARVIIDGERYAGTWQHEDVGGHLFGRIRKADEKGDRKS